MAEVVTAEELAEVNLFLDAVLETEVMKVHVAASSTLEHSSLIAE